MAIKLSDDLISLLNSPSSKKVLSTVGRDGTPHAVFKDSIHADADGYISYCEYIETSRANKNMVHSMWFGRSVSIAVIGEDGRGFQITGKPSRAVICGADFEEAYIAVRKLMGGEADLSTIWKIEPEEVRDETFGTRLREQTARYPLVGHIDRFLER